MLPGITWPDKANVGDKMTLCKLNYLFSTLILISNQRKSRNESVRLIFRTDSQLV